MAASDELPGFILHKLKAPLGLGILRKDNGCRIIEEGPDQSFEGECETLLVMTKYRVRKSAKDV